MNDTLAYTSIAVKLWKDIRHTVDENLTGDDPTSQVLEHIMEAFVVVDHIAEQRLKKALPDEPNFVDGGNQ